ncbi:hypothetical protein [Undibacterium terreum]|uniref:hypothetical protein n=1 Tax=Undibacterium terreum TaxID=1224302 RepID=UPI00166AD16D|nr:hypothetical protein [Undibacterium terreum]
MFVLLINLLDKQLLFENFPVHDISLDSSLNLLAFEYYGRYSGPHFSYPSREELTQIGTATYFLEGKQHQIEVWRDRDQNLKRKTDDVLETYVFKRPGEIEWNMVVLDLNRKIRTDIGRTNLYRIGHFTDWFSLSHSLARPKTSYQLKTDSQPQASEKASSSCTWYSLEQQGLETKICWSKAFRLPLLITDRDGRTQWRVASADSRQLSALAFKPHDEGFVKNNANDDIQPD